MASTSAKSIIAALDDDDLFGGMFDAPSWEPWRAFLHALAGLPMSPAHLALYRHHTGRAEPPTKAARYAELVVGRRGGKSRVLALIATYMACVLDHHPFIVPGETPVVAVIARDRMQAKVILSYIVGFMRNIVLFAAMIADELAESVRLTNGVVVEVHTASISAPRGRTFLAVLCDETAFWPTGDSANPDVEVINAVRPGLSTIPYSLLLVASSPYARRGILYTNYSKYFGKDDAPVLVWQGATQEMNSSLVDDPLIAEMYLEDPDRASAEFGGLFRTDIVAFITREAIEDVVARGVRELPAGAGITYFGFVDPSGGSADSMTLGIAHCEADGVAVLDCLREVRPPFSPDAVVEEFASLLKSYGVARVTGDAYAGEWPRERFAVHGITYEVSKKNKSVIYSEFLPALNGQRVRLLDLPRLIGQLVTLERRTARGGRDSIDHAPSSQDDVANAACGALVYVIADRRPALVRQGDMLNSGEALPLPKTCAYLAATFASDKHGTAAIVYAGFPLSGKSPAMFILDFDVGPMRGGTFADIANRMQELLTACDAPRAIVFVPPDLRRHAIASGLPAEEIPIDLLPEERLLSVAAHVGSGNVKICAPALDKARNSPFAGALDFRAGELADDPLRAAAILLVAMGLDQE